MESLCVQLKDEHLGLQLWKINTLRVKTCFCGYCIIKQFIYVIT